MGRPCYLSAPMKEMWKGMEVEYLQRLEANAKKRFLTNDERRCSAFITACVDKFEATFADDFNTTPYGENKAIIPSSHWCNVSGPYAAYQYRH